VNRFQPYALVTTVSNHTHYPVCIELLDTYPVDARLNDIEEKLNNEVSDYPECVKILERVE